MLGNPACTRALHYYDACAYVFMHVPCWKLPALHRAVRARPEGGRMEVAGGYLAVLAEASSRT